MCPCCGYCPHCGRSNITPAPYIYQQYQYPCWTSAGNLQVGLGQASTSETQWGNGYNSGLQGLQGSNADLQMQCSGDQNLASMNQGCCAQSA
jgi:hypothetical protein